MWKNIENIRKQVEDGAKEFAQAAIEGVRDLKVYFDKFYLKVIVSRSGSTSISNSSSIL
jgi:hypothetical protein